MRAQKNGKVATLRPSGRAAIDGATPSRYLRITSPDKLESPMIDALVPLLVSLSCWAPPAQAQLLPEDDKRVIAWPATDITPATKGRIVVGDVTGDLELDAVLLNGERPVVAYAPAIHQAVFELDLDVHVADLAILSATQPGAADTLAVVGDDGLYLIEDLTSAEPVAVPVGSSAWVGATGLRAADTDMDGEMDLVGLSEDDEILFLEDVLGSSPTETVLAIGETVYDFVPIDWKGDGSPLRVAVVTPSGLQVRTKAGGKPFSLSGTFASGLVDAFRQSDVPYERIAAVCGAAGTQFLVVADRNGGDAALALGTDTIFGMTLADVDLDGDDDLYLLHRVSHETVLFVNQSDSPAVGSTFADGFGELVDVAPSTTPSSSWSAGPALADFSGDGDPDALVFVETTQEFVLVESTSRSLGHYQVQVPGGAYYFDGQEGSGLLLLDLTIGSSFTFTSTHVEIIVWRQVVEGEPAELGPLEPTAIMRVLRELDSSDETVSDLLLAEPSLSTAHVYHLELRAVRVENGSVLEAGPSGVHAFTTNVDAVLLLEGEHGGGVPLDVFELVDDQWIVIGTEEAWDRQVAPKHIETDEIPPISEVPDPLG